MATVTACLPAFLPQVDDEDEDDDMDADDEDAQPPPPPVTQAPAVAGGKSVRMCEPEAQPKAPPAYSSAFGLGDLDDIERPLLKKGPSGWTVFRRQARAVYRRLVPQDIFKINGRVSGLRAELLSC